MNSFATIPLNMRECTLRRGENFHHGRGELGRRLRSGRRNRGRSHRLPFRGDPAGGLRRGRESANHAGHGGMSGGGRGDVASGRGGVGGPADVHGEPRPDGERGGMYVVNSRATVALKSFFFFW